MILKFRASYNRSNVESQAITNSTDTVDVLPQNILLTQTGFNTQNASTVYEQHLLYGTDYQYLSGKDLAARGDSEKFPTSTQQLYSVFFQDSWDIIESLNVTVGGRANGYFSEASGQINNGVLFTKQATVTYKIIEKWSVYVGYNEGFKIPSLQELYYSGLYAGRTDRLFVANPNLKPEVSQIKTLGTSFTQEVTETQSFTLSGNIFLNNVKNYIILTDVGSGTGPTPVERQSVNIDKALLYGYVVNGLYNTPWFGLATNFTYTRGETQTAYENEKGGSIPSGNPLPIPRAKGMVSVMIPIEVIESDFTTTVNYAIAQNYIPITSSASSVPGYTLLGFAYSWHPIGLLGGFNITAGVDNVLNQDYVNYDPNNLYINPAMGRNLYAQATYNF
ncbi:MAG: hemoglobin/transferrin/lactoferrin receptor protein [Francisellaceae bacterium]